MSKLLLDPKPIESQPEELIWSEILEQLLTGQSLSQPAACQVMQAMLAGQATSAQISALLVALRSKGASTPELLGFLQAMWAVAELVPLDSQALNVVDTCGTGGDGLRTLNISTISAIVVAGAGGKVCKHGNRAVSSASGSADVLESLGIDLEMTPEQVAQSVLEVGIGFCFAPRFHPAMRFVGPTRRELGIPTVFNFLGPLANPARVKRQIVGTSDLAMAEPLANVLKQVGHSHAMVFFGESGMDELSIAGPSLVLHLRDGHMRRYEIDPRRLGLQSNSLEELRGGDAAVNAEIACSVLAGQKGAPRNIVVLNSAAALVVADQVGELAEGVEAAQACIDSGDALKVLERWQDFSRDTRQQNSQTEAEKTKSGSSVKTDMEVSDVEKP